MGMYDHLRSDYPLGPKHHPGDEIQTKSIKCNMDYYWIDQSGQLYLEREFFDKTIINRPITDLTDDIETIGPKERGYYEYRIMFQNGKVVWSRDIEDIVDGLYDEDDD